MPLHVVYFENRHGRISLPPTSDTVTPPGYERREANTIFELMALERRLQRESTDRAEQEAELDASIMSEPRRRARQAILDRMASVDTDPETKEMLRLWCQLKDEQRRVHYANIIHQRLSYFEALHYDKPRNAEEILGESL